MAKKKGSGNKFGVKYSKTVTKSVANFKFNADINNAESRTPNFNKEVQRVFHAANRRIQNLTNANALSPALNALNAFLNENDDTAHFAKFAKLSSAGKSLDEIKRLYNAAIEFLQKPTSTASGAAQFTKEIQKRGNISDAQMNFLKEKINNGEINAFTENVFLLHSSDIQKVLDFYVEKSNSLADQIENAATNETHSGELDEALETDVLNELNKGFLKWKKVK